MKLYLAADAMGEPLNEMEETPGNKSKAALMQMGDVSTTSPLLCSFNAVKKLEPIAISAWAHIMVQVPSARLVLLQSNQASLRNLLAELALRGVSPTRVLVTDAVCKYFTSPKLIAHVYLSLSSCRGRSICIEWLLVACC